MSRQRLIGELVVLILLFFLTCGLTAAYQPLWLATASTQVGAIIVMVVVLVRRYDISLPTVASGLSFRSTIHVLRRMGLPVEEKDGRGKVPINDYMQIVLTPERHYFRIEPTYNTWALFALSIFLAFVPFIGILGFVLTLYLFVHANTFASSLIAETAKYHKEEADNAIDILIIDGLSEGNRIANEALMDERSEYYDHALILMMPAAIVSIIAIFGLVFLLGGPGLLNGLVAIGLGIIIAATIILVPMHVLGKSYQKRTAELRAWSSRFQEALRQEQNGSEAEEGCSLELLLQASEKIPSWLAIGRKSMVHRHPFLSLVIVILGFVSLGLLFSALQPMDIMLQILSLTGAMGLAVVAIVLYSMVRKRDREEIGRSISDWNSRYAQARQNMERTLEDL
jgi:hypothetical protein